MELKYRFVVLEGVNGCGKTTQVDAITDILRSDGLSVFKTFEPSSRFSSEKIKYAIETGVYRDPRTTVLLYCANRVEHVRAIRGILKLDDCVLCSRFTPSTIAYQSYGQGVDLAWVDSMIKMTTGDFQPDACIWIDTPIEVCLERLSRRDSAGVDPEILGQYLRKVRRGYLRFFENTEVPFLRISEDIPSELTTSKILDFISET
jgi:dTMP kinase